jgi:hypothetical protein
MKNNSVALALTLYSMVIIGCATIVEGTTQNISVTSNVDKAEVYINGNRMGFTPWTGLISKKKDTVLLLHKDGYRDESRILTTRVPGIFWGNILLGGLLGSTTDMASGAIYEYSPGSYSVTMETIQVTNSEPGEFEKETKIRNFILASYADIIKGLGRGENEHLISLLVFLEIGDDGARRQKAINKLKAISELTSDASSFADAVIGYSRKKSFG